VAAWINQPKQISTLHLESKLFNKVSNFHWHIPNICVARFTFMV